MRVSNDVFTGDTLKLPLTDTQCRSCEAKDKAYKLSDAGGLYLHVTKTGRKYWRMNYRYGEKSKTLAIGVYPEVSLKEARNQRDIAKKLLAEGKDPSFEKQRSKLREQTSGNESFEAVAHEWLETRKDRLSINYFKQLTSTLNDDICPVIGKIPIGQVTAPELLLALRKIEERGALDMARKARQCCGQIFRYAIATGKAERDIAADLKGALKIRKTENRAYLSEAELPDFFQQLAVYDGDRLTALAIQLVLLTFVRTKELRGARWNEIDFKSSIWRIPAERMKMERPHMVPLSRQALVVLDEVQKISGDKEHVFPNSRTPSKP